MAGGPEDTSRATGQRPDRLESVDLLRGVVMALMALDHVRDFFSDRLYMDPVDLSTTTPGIFLTRWITHYCAPTFIFLAGAGAFLSGTRGKSTKDLSIFLLTRGLWLALFELTVVRASWYFNYDVYHHGAGVFWAIGWSMVVLAGLVWLPLSVITVFGLAMIGYHNLLDGLSADQMHLPRWLWIILHSPGDAPILSNVQLGLPPGPLLGPVPPGPPPSYDLTFGTGYCLIPWMGVMAAGYGFGSLLTLERRVRRRELLGLGVALTLLFVLLRAANVYGDPKPWEPQFQATTTANASEGEPALSIPFTIFSFLNCTKYPPSLLFSLMTLGPAILALGVFESLRGPVFQALAKPLIVFGRVPLFYYLLHIPLIHGGVALLDYVRFGWSPQALDGPWAVHQGDVPSNYGVSLPVVYLLWIAVLLILYPPCRWFAGVKQRHRAGWLSYL